ECQEANKYDMNDEDEPIELWPGGEDGWFVVFLHGAKVVN
ncbi:MAG: hypothetical protein ACJATF_003442, partial [Flavobacteriales bacterium]